MAFDTTFISDIMEVQEKFLKAHTGVLIGPEHKPESHGSQRIHNEHVLKGVESPVMTHTFDR